MAHDYLWEADGTALSTYTTFQRLLTYGGTGKRGTNPTIPYKHGEHSDYDKWFPGMDLLLEVGLKTNTPFSHLSDLQALFGKTTGLVVLKQTTPNVGTIRASVELLADPTPTQDRYTYLFPLRNPKGFWEDDTLSTASGTAPTINTTGDRPIDDMIITFSAPATATHTDAAGVVSTMEWAGTGSAIVDCGARTVKKAGADEDANLIVDQAWWMRFAPQTTGVSITATASITVDWRNKWTVG